MKESMDTADIATASEIQNAFAAAGIEQPTSEQRESLLHYVRREAQEAARRALASWVEHKQYGKE
ncbi:MAG: hypothetical protein H0U76_04010 [Ktedonobacteraceae bacterium]|nr:hypothetical protein [Ktedonobacteraceae bacterium]